MKLKCYGTAAAEAIPALYCSCPVCEAARAAGGKEIRGRHLSTLDDDIQFDIGPDFFYQIQVQGLEPRKIRHLVVTHTHGDHFAPDSLAMRVAPFSLALDNDMALYGSEKTVEVAKAELRDLARLRIEPKPLAPYAPTAMDADTTITALPANHAPGLGAMIYLVERKGKKLLYAHDTGPFFQEVIDYLAGKALDAVTLDCTGAYNGAGDHHMQLSSCEDMVKALRANGGLKADATIIINHYSHGGGASQAQLEKEAADRGWIAAYDGIEIEI